MTGLLTADEAARLTLGVNVIVRPGEPCLLQHPLECNGRHADLFPPSAWVALTGPCPTCGGKAVHLKSVALGSHRYASECGLCETDGHMHMWDCPNHPRNIDSGTRNDAEPPSGGLRAMGVAKSTDGRPAVVSPWRVPCPPNHCLGLPGCDGVQCVAEPCPDCRGGRRIVPLYTLCTMCGGNATSACGGRHPYRDGRVLMGRAAVVSIEPEDDGRNFRITLDVVEVA